jgi:hypothetical protein
VVLTQLAMLARGLSGVPLGLNSSVSGSTSGSDSSGTATGVSLPSGKMMGKGSPQ